MSDDERVTHTKLMSIGAFAKLAGLTASALRFYDDAALLRPERVDPLTGYRLYGEAQLAPATQLRRLREIGMPLPTIGEFFTADVDEATQLIDQQVAKVTTDAREVQRTAATLKASLARECRRTLCALPGPMLADAFGQIVASTIRDPDIPVMGGVRLEIDAGSVALTATDRYRLTTRTLVPTRSTTGSWAGTLAGDDLPAMTSRLRRSTTVTIEAGDRTLGFRSADGVIRDCRLLTEAFPDHRLLLSSLPAVTHRVTAGKRQAVRVLEQRAPENIGLRITDHGPSLLLPDGDAVDLAGSASGGDLTVWFELITLYPALNHAVGTDLMLDLRGPDQPATIRSADSGDLTALVMPCRAREPDR